LVRRFYKNKGDILEAVSELYQNIYGMTSTAMLFGDARNLLLATNNGSLYYANSINGNIFLFASERYILQTLLASKHLQKLFDPKTISQLLPNYACLVNLEKSSVDIVSFKTKTSNHSMSLSAYVSSLPTEDIVLPHNEGEVYINTSLEHTKANVPAQFIQHLKHSRSGIEKIKRCVRCILPETFPFITFNAQGVCNFCLHYKKLDFEGESQFKNLVDRYRSKTGGPDCLVPFSGGRDSSYVLHYLKKELGLNPLAFSYDWGMLTDLGRRNQARMCGKLGVEHILISADVRKKRSNIKKNVLAWLQKPSLGTVPLFMAGDKQYFYFSNLLLSQNNLHLSILGENMLETTNFKSGFCGIPPKFGSGHTYSLSLNDKLKMLLFYGREYITNPAYLNASLLDTLDAFRSYYVIKHETINMFNYLPWDETTIIKTLRDEYDWEIADDTKTTWRIGDGTASFYNYIYYIVAGFTENDTFRSNQIREGMLTREEGLEKSRIDNEIRWDSIHWYCRTIQIDFERAIKIINSIPKLYSFE
jgi:hypothetical protein